MESWLAVHLLIKRSRSNRAWPSLALSSPESRSTRSVGRVHLASIISSMIKFVSLFEIDDNVVVIMSHSGRKHPCQNFKIVTNVKADLQTSFQVLASCLAAATLAQFIEPEKAKILKEQKLNAGDGR